MQHVHSHSLPAFAQGDVRLSESLIEVLVEHFTAPGGSVFDPFAGFGTVLLVSERLGRAGYGLEIDAERARYARTLLKAPERLLEADARQLAALGLPRFDLCLSSPPYMQQGDAEDPLSGYRNPGNGYAAYLAELCAVYSEAARGLTPEGHLVIEVSNLKRGSEVTTLAWDLGKGLADTLRFLGETVVVWDQYAYGYEHSYVLVFRR